MAKIRLDHIALLVRDLEQSVKDYQAIFEALGNLPTDVVCHSGLQNGHRYKSATFVGNNGETVIQLIQSEHPKDLSLLEKRGECVHHLEFCTDNMKETVAAITEAKIPLVSKTPEKSKEMPWQESVLVSPSKTHGTLVKVSTAYKVKNGKWMPSCG